MPLLGTRGAASARGFGFTNAVSSGGPYWLLSQNMNSGTYLQANDLAVDSSFNVYTIGFSTPPSTAYQAFQLTKYDKSGTLLWQRKLQANNSSSACQGNSIAVDSSGNIYVLGLSELTGLGNYFLQVAKYSSSGVIQFQTQYNQSLDYTYGAGITTDSSGNFYVAGNTNNSGGVCLTLKFNSSGVLQWQRKYGSGTSSSYGGGIAVDSSGYVYVVGYYSGSGGQDPFILKYDNSGTIQWQRNLFQASVSDIFAKVAVDTSGNIYAVGSTNFGGTFQNILFVKYNSSGSVQFQRTIGAASYTDEAQGVYVDSGGNVFVSGSSSETGDNKAYIFKYNSSGVIQWQRRLGNSSTTFGRNVVVSPSTDVHVLCSMYTTIGSYNPLIAKLPSDGTKTGTYTLGAETITYTTSSLAEAAYSLTEQIPTRTEAALSLSSATTSLTDGTTSYTNTLTTV